jgi:hypothetical protein
MGTNFYMRTNNLENYNDNVRDDSNDAKFSKTIHLGKRSAAGPWCFECGITLCKDGINGIHTSKSEWYKEGDKYICPNCGKEVKTTCCSWIWAVDPGDVFFKAELMANSKKKIILDEYGREFTGDEFLAELETIPVKYTHSIGVNFS